MGETLVCGAPWDGTSTASGCMNGASMRAGHGNTAWRGQPCDGVPSPCLSMRSDCTL